MLIYCIECLVWLLYRLQRWHQRWKVSLSSTYQIGTQPIAGPNSTIKQLRKMGTFRITDMSLLIPNLAFVWQSSQIWLSPTPNTTGFPSRGSVVLMEVPKIFFGIHTLPKTVMSLFGCLQERSGHLKLIGLSTKNLIVKLYWVMEFCLLLGWKWPCQPHVHVVCIPCLHTGK